MGDKYTPAFSRYIGIDYSGARTPNDSLPGLRAYLAQGESSAKEVTPPPSPRKYWTRREIAEWLAEILAEDIPTIVGIDHGFSFPLRYFEVHHLPPDWPGFLVDFQQHWPTDENRISVEFIRKGECGNGAERTGSPRWRRLTEERCGAKSVFHFDVPGSVAKSTHAGIPWLLFLRRTLGTRLHFWPFDGWTIPAGCSTLVEAYPSLWKHAYPRENRTADQHDAYTIAGWLQENDLKGGLSAALTPRLSAAELAVAEVEGWIIGVG